MTLLDTADAFQGENFERNLELTAADLERIDAAVPRPVGDRYDETGMRTLNR